VRTDVSEAYTFGEAYTFTVIELYKNEVEMRYRRERKYGVSKYSMVMNCSLVLIDRGGRRRDQTLWALFASRLEEIGAGAGI
jgi:hypothetical protein